MFGNLRNIRGLMKNKVSFTRNFINLSSMKHTEQVRISEIEAKKRDLQLKHIVEEWDQGFSSEQKKGMKRFDIYRYDGESNDVTKKINTYYIDLKECGPMVLDALIKIKDEIDPTLSFRRSCREGICGSCSMNIDGRNTLACLSYIDTNIDRPSNVMPLPYFAVVRDLVVDMTTFYMQYKAIHPVLMRKTPKVN
jgi:hypothetical protein